MIDPSKDKFAYFKDNIQTAEDKDFDASQYYYHRDDFSSKGVGSSGGPGGSGVAGTGHMSLSGFHAMGSGLTSALDGDSGAGPNRYATIFQWCLAFCCSELISGDFVCRVDAGIGQHGVFSGFSSTGMMSASGSNSFLSASVGRGSLTGAPPPSHELHRMNSGRSLPVENKAPDMSEFPALGSRMNSLNLDTSSEIGSESRMRTQPSEFVIQKEDFPALSTFGPNSSDKSAMQEAELKRHSSFTSSALDGMAPQRSGSQALNNTSIGSRSGAVPGFAATGAPAGSSSGGAGGSSVSLSGGAFGQLHSSRSGATSNGQLDPSNKYGLLGMLHSVIRPSNESKKNLAMGCDLTTLGLNLNSAEPLHPTFASPWSEGSLTKEPQFTLPMCYYNQPPVLKTTHLSKFHLETLFYIFYSMPKDVLQAYAAQELYSREWRYHVELKMWLKRASPADTALLAATSSSLSGSPGGAASGPGASLSSSIGPSTSVGSIGSAPASGATAGAGSIGGGALGPQFLYFDTTTWERRVFTGNIHSVSTGLMSEEEIRVKYNAAS
ncbi:Not transcription complex subunit vip2, partial [Globisporangium splendens]